MITSLAFSPDGNILASGDGTGAVQLWNPATRQPIGRLILVVQGGQVGSLAFSPDSKILASGGTDQTVRLWKVQ